MPLKLLLSGGLHCQCKGQAITNRGQLSWIKQRPSAGSAADVGSTMVGEQLVIPARKVSLPGQVCRDVATCKPLALMNPAARQGLQLLHGQAWNSAPQLNSLLVRQLASLAASSPSVTPSADLPGLWRDQSWSTWVQDLQESCSALWQHTTQSLWLAVPKRKVCAWKPR